MKRIVVAFMLLAGGIGYAGTVGTGVAPLDTPSENATSWVANTTDGLVNGTALGNVTDHNLSNVSVNVSNVSGGTGPTRAAELNETRIAKLVHEKVNERRAAHGRGHIAWDPALARIADSHAEDMAERGYYSHTAPDGSGFTDRYARHGYECKVPVGGNRYLVGAENIQYTFYKERLLTEGDDYYSTPEELAAGIVSGWMHSPGHRKNLLKGAWQHEGIGIAATRADGDIKVYAVQNFC